MQMYAYFKRFDLVLLESSSTIKEENLPLRSELKKRRITSVECKWLEFTSYRILLPFLSTLFTIPFPPVFLLL